MLSLFIISGLVSAPTRAESCSRFSNTINVYYDGSEASIYELQSKGPMSKKYPYVHSIQHRRDLSFTY